MGCNVILCVVRGVSGFGLSKDRDSSGPSADGQRLPPTGWAFPSNGPCSMEFSAVRYVLLLLIDSTVGSYNR
jgi:hypothetical protein